MAAKSIDASTNPYGSFLRKIREDYRLTQKNLARDAGLTASALSKLELEEDHQIPESVSDALLDSLSRFGVPTGVRRALKKLEITRVKSIDVRELNHDDVRVLLKLVENYKARQVRRASR